MRNIDITKQQLTEWARQANLSYRQAALLSDLLAGENKHHNGITFMQSVLGMGQYEQIVYGDSARCEKPESIRLLCNEARVLEYHMKGKDVKRDYVLASVKSIAQKLESI